VSKGISKEAAEFTCNAVRAGARQTAITTIEEYQEAWTICHAAEGILTTLDDGSEAAAWCASLAHAIIDFEDAYEAQHGRRPLNPGPPEWTEGPQGSA